MGTEKSRKLDAAERATKRARQAAEDRDEKIRDAVEANSIRAVAKRTGLSPARVHQIVHGR